MTPREQTSRIEQSSASGRPSATNEAVRRRMQTTRRRDTPAEMALRRELYAWAEVSRGLESLARACGAAVTSSSSKPVPWCSSMVASGTAVPCTGLGPRRTQSGGARRSEGTWCETPTPTGYCIWPDFTWFVCGHTRTWPEWRNGSRLPSSVGRHHLTAALVLRIQGRLVRPPRTWHRAPPPHASGGQACPQGSGR